jgi:hypothetical protein
MIPGWRCAECHCTWAIAERRRRRAGLSDLRVSAVCCTPACADARDAQLRARRYVKHPPNPLRDRIPWPWRCSECGKGLGEVNAERRRRGLRSVNTGRQRVCSPACAKLRWRRWYARRFGPGKTKGPGRRREW